VTGTVRYVQQTGAGLQPIDVELDGDRCTSAMLQAPASFGPEVDPAPALQALGLAADDAHPTLPSQLVATGLRFQLLPLASREALGRIRSDPHAVDAVIAAGESYGVLAAWCEPELGRARVRMFGRSEQIVEDPATGSAAGPLCVYLHQRTGSNSLELNQGAEIGRPSKLQAEVAGDTARVGGASVVIVDGTVRL
jgi:trans-2,3-dihydro-3-hydroxyanthranilate isomerase